MGRKKCLASSQCKSEYECRHRKCTLRKEWSRCDGSDLACPSPYICHVTLSRCVTLDYQYNPAKALNCSMDHECHGDAHCVGSVCRPRSIVGQYCLTRNDCLGEASCFRHVCVAPCFGRRDCLGKSTHCNHDMGGYCVPLFDVPSKLLPSYYSLTGLIIGFSIGFLVLLMLIMLFAYKRMKARRQVQDNSIHSSKLIDSENASHLQPHDPPPPFHCSSSSPNHAAFPLSPSSSDPAVLPPYRVT